MNDLTERARAYTETRDVFEIEPERNFREITLDKFQLAELLASFASDVLADQWVAVSERLPEVDDMYLTVSLHGDKQLFDTCRFVEGDWGMPHRELVVAWMPIPPYEERK